MLLTVLQVQFLLRFFLKDYESRRVRLVWVTNGINNKKIMEICIYGNFCIFLKGEIVSLKINPKKICDIR